MYFGDLENFVNELFKLPEIFIPKDTEGFCTTRLDENNTSIFFCLFARHLLRKYFRKRGLFRPSISVRFV